MDTIQWWCGIPSYFLTSCWNPQQSVAKEPSQSWSDAGIFSYICPSCWPSHVAWIFLVPNHSVGLLIACVWPLGETSQSPSAIVPSSFSTWAYINGNQRRLMSFNMLRKHTASCSPQLSQASLSQNSGSCSWLCSEQLYSAPLPLGSAPVFSATLWHVERASPWLNLAKRITSRLLSSRRWLLFGFKHRGYYSSQTMGLYRAFSVAAEVLHFIVYLSYRHSQYGLGKSTSSTYYLKQCWLLGGERKRSYVAI